MERVLVRLTLLPTRYLELIDIIADVALASKINEELKFEKEGSDTSTPAFVTEFKKKGIWNVRTARECENVIKLTLEPDQ